VRNRLIAARAHGWNLAFIGLLCGAIFYWNLGLLPFYTRGESREGLVVWEMVRTGDWILPAINGEYIPFKPPLFHWVGAVLSKFSGIVDEFTVRLPSALFGTFGVLLTYFAAAHFWNPRAGVIAAMVLATSTEWWNSALIAQVDMTLAFFITAALLLFYAMYRGNRYGIARSSLLAALLACATLSKGPLGIAVPVFVIIVFLAIRRDFEFFKKLHLLSGAVVFLLIAGSWYGTAGWHGGWAFFRRQILEENIGTARGVWGHYQSYFYFFKVFFFNFAPWSLFVPSVVYFIYQRRRELFDFHLLFPLVWFLSVFLFFTLSFGKRGVYILPLYPAAALLFAACWSSLERSEKTLRWLTAAITYIIAASVLIAFTVVVIAMLQDSGSRLFSVSKKLLAAARFVNSLEPFRPMAWGCIILFGLGPLMICWFLLQRKWNGALIALTVVVGASTIFLQITYYPAFAAVRTLKPFMLRVSQEVNPETPLFFYDWFDGSAIFYTHRHIPLYQQNVGVSPAAFLLMREEVWEQLSKTNSLTLIDVSEGGGPTGRHPLVLVKTSGKGPATPPSVSTTAQQVYDESTPE